MNDSSKFEPLYTADPDIADEFTGQLTEDALSVLTPYLKICMEDIVWGLSEETSFGRTMAKGYAALAIAGKKSQIPVYHDQVIKFGTQGPALGKIMAEHLVPVLKLEDSALSAKFLHVIEVMLKKGTYTLYNPLNAMDLVCETNDKKSIYAYLDLLEQTFSLDLTYKQCRPFTYTLPKAVASFSPPKRAFQIKCLSLIIQKDFTLSDYFLEGLSGGLRLLSEAALDDFVAKGLEKYEKNKKLCAKFLSLGSKLGLDTFSDLQVTVPLSQVRPAIVQYINARTGVSISINSIAALPKQFTADTEFKPLVSSDGKSIYMPDEISQFEDREKNLELYKILAKLEVGYFEFHTFDFDLEKLKEKTTLIQKISDHSDIYVSDFESFLESFNNPKLAIDLFTVFEHGRIMALTLYYYPGLARRLLPLLKDHWPSSLSDAPNSNPIHMLYETIVLEIYTDNIGIPHEVAAVLKRAGQAFDEKMQRHPSVETSAELTLLFYPEVEKLVSSTHDAEVPWSPINPPFDRKIIPRLFFHAIQNMDQKAQLLKSRLEKLGVRVYRSNIRKKLVETNGSLSLSDIKQLILNPMNSFSQARSEPPGSSSPQAKTDISQLDLAKLMDQSGITPVQNPEIKGPAFYYKEWDNRLGDYLQQHTLVHEKPIPCKADGFYEDTLGRYPGLIKQIRYAFELLKPEGITILRQWIEGDEFDYRALLDFAMDKKAGIMPSDKLYIKKIKQQRDVAVLLLVDLSRSTSNLVLDSSETVLDIEKQAIILFCEALQVVGDTYAVAGFSGTGRLGVDYFTIKDFDEALNDAVRQKINAMAPQRSTRMGAAIRHATARIEKNSAMVRLIIIIGDGFPNDVDYKKDYAISDTRKAILEARSKNIYTHALTVNITGDPKLDELYGNVHHHVISDVRELPDKLPRIYSSLTRY